MKPLKELNLYTFTPITYSMADLNLPVNPGKHTQEIVSPDELHAAPFLQGLL